MIPVKDGYNDLENATFDQIRDEYAGRILEAFVEDGGKGLRYALRECMLETLRWKRIQDAKKAKECQTKSP